jgi:hypothetical protein
MAKDSAARVTSERIQILTRAADVLREENQALKRRLRELERALIRQQSRREPVGR